MEAKTISKKKFIGLSLALTVAFSSLMLVKAMLFAPRQTVTVKTGNGKAPEPGNPVRETPSEAKPEVPEKAAEAPEEEIPVQEAACEEAPEAPADGGKLNINTASAEELQELPGIGPSLSEAVAAYRQENGPFKSIEDIMNVSGIGQAKFDSIAELISVGD